MKQITIFFALILPMCFLFTSCAQNENQPDLSKAVLVVSPSIAAPMKSTLVQVLTEEVEKRTSLKINQAENWDNKTIVALALSTDKELFGLNP